ncbi:MAG: RNase adapter RapZ [Bacteroidetes bacterium]|nr:RNase adapter RapZ [Bacteroidota bacterium]
MPVKKQSKTEVVIITGVSGAGKTQAIRSFEDMGYFCIDNLPPTLIPKVAELVFLPGSRVKRIALVIDVRGGELFDAVWDTLRELKAKQIDYKILFLDASDETVIKRFKETRRRHPLTEDGDIMLGIKRERELLTSLRESADLIIDTTDTPAYMLKDKIRKEFMVENPRTAMNVSVVSFGYKYGLPMDADLVVDVRFLPNPHYIEKLKNLTGEDKRVRQFVLDRPVTMDFLKRLEVFLKFLMPHYVKEGKTHITIALGCTGGNHRSVVLANEIKKFLKDTGYNVVLRHRDIGRELSSEEQD